MKIIAQLLNKLSFADGTDPDLVTKSLDSNKCIEQCLSLFISIIISSPKNLFDIKKYAIRVSRVFNNINNTNFRPWIF